MGSLQSILQTTSFTLQGLGYQTPGVTLRSPGMTAGLHDKDQTTDLQTAEVTSVGREGLMLSSVLDLQNT